MTDATDAGPGLVNTTGHTRLARGDTSMASAPPAARPTRPSTPHSSLIRYPAPSPLEWPASLPRPPSLPPLPPLPPWARDALDDPATVAVLAAGAAAGATLLGVRVYRRYWRRIRNADSVTGAMIERQPWITGVVTRVGDGDNFRLYHTPGLFWRWPLKLRRVPTNPKDLKNETLSIRIAGVDAPENAHFGKPAQPHAKESLEWLQRTATGRRVKVQLLRKDQYNRIVGVPYLTRFLLPNQPLPLMMLRAGQAVVYTQGGAEYGPWGLSGLEAAENEAKRARRGVWAARSLELPGDYKRRMKEGGEAVKEKVPAKMGWWERLGRWLGGKT